MTREEAIKAIDDLYGLNNYMDRMLMEFGIAAFTDEALIWIANLQLRQERERGELLDRVAKYHDNHPGLSWRECEGFVKVGA